MNTKSLLVDNNPEAGELYLAAGADVVGVQLEAGALEVLHLQALAVLALRAHARADRIAEQPEARMVGPIAQERLTHRVPGLWEEDTEGRCGGGRRGGWCGCGRDER